MDSGGVSLTEKEIDQYFEDAMQYNSKKDFDRAEAFMATLGEDRGLDSLWYTALMGDYEEMESLVPEHVATVLNSLFETGQ